MAVLWFLDKTTGQKKYTNSAPRHVIHPNSGRTICNAADIQHTAWEKENEKKKEEEEEEEKKNEEEKQKEKKKEEKEEEEKKNKEEEKGAATGAERNTHGKYQKRI